MGRRTFLSLSSRINPSVPGCPLPLIAQHVHRAAIVACERTLAWRYQQNSLPLTAGVSTYSFRKPVDTEVCAILHASVNGETPLEPLPLDRATELFPRWESGTPDDTDEVGRPRYITEIGPSQFVLLPSPDDEEVYTLRMIVALKPSSEAHDMDGAVMGTLEEAIVSKALQELLMLPNKQWGDQKMAGYYAREFLTRVGEYRAQANIGKGRGTLVARAPKFV